MQEKLNNDLGECLDCDLPTQDRLNYFTGQFLAERDFRDEQAYHIGKHRQHNRYLHGWGTVCGLKVTQHPNAACRDRFVIIEPGLALDCCGREIVVREPVYVDLDKHLAPKNGSAEAEGKYLLISLCYTECGTELVPALYSECGCDEDQREPNRVREGFEVELSYVDELPQAYNAEAVNVTLDWSTTINLRDAIRVALDSERNLLYVLTQEGQLYVYETNHYCLLRSASIQGQGVDLALSASGEFLYVIRYGASEAEDDEAYYLRVLSQEDLETIKDVLLADGDHTPGAIQPILQVGSEDTSGKVFALDNLSDESKVRIWNSDINSRETDPSSYVEAFASSPSAITVSPDGVWLFIAEAHESSRHIRAIQVEILSSEDSETSGISLDIPDPVLLAVSGDSRLLLVVTASKQLRVFQIPDSTGSSTLSITFEEVGNINLGEGELISLVASPSGRWAYVLSRDDDGKGKILTVDLGKLETGTDYEVEDGFAVLSNPQKLILSEDGRMLYAVGQGNGEVCGGVSVVEINEEACRELMWRALDGCHDCPEDICVPLAVISGYDYGDDVTNQGINNRIRPLVPSTETLKQLVLCALETRTGKEGPPGQPGQDGGPGVTGARVVGTETGEANVDVDYVEDDKRLDFTFTIPAGVPGENGENGLGLNTSLPKILDIQWKHKDTYLCDENFLSLWGLNLSDPNRIFNIKTDDQDYKKTPGLFTIYFNKEMSGHDIQTFKVWIDYPGIMIDQNSTTSLTGLYNQILYKPDSNIFNKPDSNITTSLDFVLFPILLDLKLFGRVFAHPFPEGAEKHITPHTKEDSPWAITFVPHANSFKQVYIMLLFFSSVKQLLFQEDPKLLPKPCVHIRLEGDFIKTEGTPDTMLDSDVLDANNIGGQVGKEQVREGFVLGGKNPSGNLTQGGVFESWFFLDLPEVKASEDSSSGEARNQALRFNIQDFKFDSENFGSLFQNFSG